jgi:hypothetical protein
MPLFVKKHAHLLILLIVGVISTGNMIFTDFIGDDIGRIVSRSTIFDEGLAFTLSELLSDRPFLMFTIWLNYVSSGLDPMSYKFVNVLIHLACGFSFYYLLLEVFKNENEGKLLSLVAASIFLAHPINNQAVNSIIQRGVGLSTLTALLSILFFLHAVKNNFRRDFYLISILSFLLALISKPNTLFVPFIIILLARFLKNIELKALLKLLIPFFILMLLPAVFYALGENLQYRGPSSFEYLQMQMRVILFYFQKYIVPLDLQFYYPFNNDISQLINSMTPVYALIHVALLTLGIWLFIKDKVQGLLVVFGYICLAPESSFFAIMHPVFDHRNYMAVLFFSAALFVTLHKVFQKYRVPKKFYLLFSGAIILTLAALNFNYTQKISSYEKWVLYNLEKNPTYSNSYTYVISTELARKNYNFAAQLIDLVSKHNPNDPELSFLKSYSRFQNQSATDKLRILQDSYAYAFSKGFSRFTFNYFEDLLSSELVKLVPYKEYLYRLNLFYFSFNNTIFMHNSEKILLAKVEHNFIEILKINNRDKAQPETFFENIDLDDAYVTLRSLLGLHFYFGYQGINVQAYQTILQTKFSGDPKAQEILNWLSTQKPVAGL